MNDTGIDLYDGIEMTGLSTTNSTLDLYDGIDVAGLNTTNSTLDGQEINPFYFFEFHFIVLWILFFSIVIGNTAVLAALFMNHARKSSRTKYFIMQLAIADLLVGVISVSSDIVGKVKVVWEAGLVACKVMKFSQAFVTYYSTYVLVALSIDRFDAITRPMNFRGSWRRAHLLIMFSWTLSVIFSLPLSYFYEVSVIKGKLQCWIDMPPWQWKIYMSLVALTIFFIPAVIIALCYVFIVRTIWSKSQILSPTRLDNGKGHEDHDIRRSSSRGIIPRAKIKTVKMTFVIVFVFILCWSPYIIYDLLQVYGFLPESHTSQTGVAIATFIQSLAPLNSAANPVIYCLFSTHICNSLSKIPPFSWFFCCGHENQEPSICTETTSSASRSRSLSHFRGSSTRPRPKTNNHCYESNHHDALL